MGKTIFEDDGSRSLSLESCSSATTFDIDNMTEEEAMAIWLKRNEEIGERARKRSSSASVGGGGSSSSQHGTAAADCDVSVYTHYSDSVASGDISSCSRFQHAAAVTHSDAWKRAISRNVMGEYDPQNTDPVYQNAYIAYQRFVDMNQPGVADGFVASTPGLAALMEQRRHLIARQRHLDLQMEEVDYDIMEDTSSVNTSSCQANSYAAVLSSPSAAVSQEQQGDQSITNPPLHQSRNANETIKTKNGLFSTTRLQGRNSSALLPSSPPRPSSTNTIPEGNSTDVLVATSAQILEYKRLQRAHSPSSQLLKSEEKSEKTAVFPKGGTFTNNPQPSYFYAFPYRTQYNSKAVACSSCQSCVYTTPLAKNMFCQCCGQISRVGRGQDDLESRCEGKMQDAEDNMDIGY